MTISLDAVNPVPTQSDDFSFDFESWASNTVDTINENNSDIQGQLNGTGLATFVTPKTSAEITALINMNAIPVLQVGSLWMDTTLGKLRFLVTAAVAGVSNGITETVTSV